jgi:8-oxo-dGTP pyrophosphatase MutT (NUDIX family)
MNDNLFYVTQKALIKKDGKILILLKKNGNVDFPGGKIQEDDMSITDSLKRETEEETGLKIKVNKPFHTWHFTLPQSHKNSGRKVFVIGYECDYVDGDITLSNEHGEYKWVDKTNYQSLDDGTVWYNALKEYFNLH